MALDGTTDTDETVVDTTPLSDPTTAVELAAEHSITVTNPAAVAAGTLGTPADTALSLTDVEAKVQHHGVTAESTSYTQISTDSELSNETLNQTAETLKTSVNAKLTALATTITTAFGNVSTDMGTQVQDINTKLASFKANIEGAFADLKTAEGSQNDNIASEMNRVAGVLMQNIRDVAEGVADAQGKIAALDDVYQTDSSIAERVAEVNAMIDTLRGTDLEGLQAIDGVIDAYNTSTRVRQKEIVMDAATGLYNFNISLELGVSFVDAADYIVTANSVENPQALVFIENKLADSFDVRVKSFGKHFMPQSWDGATTPVKIAVNISHKPTSDLSYVVDAMNVTRDGTDAVTVGAETTA